MNVDKALINYRRRPGASVNLYCFPCAGGSAALYRNWSELLPSWIEMWSLELPGRGRRWNEPVTSSISEIAEQTSQKLSAKTDRPFAIFGHSMGALIAYETARNLKEKRAVTPERLFLSACSPPHLRANTERKSMLADPELIEYLRELRGAPSPALDDGEIMTLMLPIVRADITACEEYTESSSTSVDCSISVYGGLSDRNIGAGQMRGWRNYTTQDYVLRMFEGGHFFVQSAETSVINQVILDLSHLA